MKKDKGFWGGVSDTVLFQPHKSESLSMWRDMYKMNRQAKRIERNLYNPEPEDETWLGKLKSEAKNAWFDFVDEVKALLTELFFHVLQLVLIIVFNILWFGGIFLLIKLWLSD